jgi:hypothetical protein
MMTQQNERSSGQRSLRSLVPSAPSGSCDNRLDGDVASVNHAAKDNRHLTIKTKGKTGILKTKDSLEGRNCCHPDSTLSNDYQKSLTNKTITNQKNLDRQNNQPANNSSIFNLTTPFEFTEFTNSTKVNNTVSSKAVTTRSFWVTPLPKFFMYPRTSFRWDINC